ncbi:MAG: hypothetical protein ACKOEC_06530, partial [Acidimicrobiia bacterium]
KNARTLLKAAAPVVAAPEAGPVFKDADLVSARDLLAGMNGLSAVNDVVQVRETYAASRVAWVELLSDADI